MNSLTSQIANLQAFEEIISEAKAQTWEQKALNAILNHERNEAIREDLGQANAQLEGLVDELTAKVREAAEVTAKVIKERDDLQEECRAMVKRNNNYTDHAQGIINKLEYQVRNLTSELKELRALNPEKLRKKVKELQGKAKIQTEANAALVKENARLKKSHHGVKEIMAQNELLRRDNKQLDLALARAVDDINNGNRVEPLQKLENGWAIFPDERHDRVVVHDSTNDAARIYSEAEGLLKIRPVPEAVKKAALAQIQDIAQRKAGMVDYQGGE